MTNLILCLHTICYVYTTVMWSHHNLQTISHEYDEYPNLEFESFHDIHMYLAINFFKDKSVVNCGQWWNY